MAGDGTPQFTIPPQQAEYEQKRADTLAAAAFTSPPADFKEALDGDRAGGQGRRARASCARCSSRSTGARQATWRSRRSIRGYGERHGLDWQRPDRLHRPPRRPADADSRRSRRCAGGCRASGSRAICSSTAAWGCRPTRLCHPERPCRGSDPDAILVASPVAEIWAGTHDDRRLPGRDHGRWGPARQRGVEARRARSRRRSRASSTTGSR